MEASAALFELASVSLACRDQDTLLRTVAARVGAAVSARAVLIWIVTEESGLVCRGRWLDTGERIQPERGPVDEGVLAEVCETGETRRAGAKQISADLLSHLDEASRNRVKAAMWVALPGADRSQGVLEVLSKRSGEFTAEDQVFAEEASRLCGQALTNLESIEGERTAHLATLDRLTALYDIGRTFTSTLELGELLPVVAEKIRSLLGGAACNIWLMDSGSAELHLAQRVGEDPTAEEGARVSASEGLLAEIAQQASPKMVTEPADEPGLEERRAAAGEDFELQCWMAAPLRKGDEVLGVCEVVNKLDGRAFDEDELFLLGQVSEQAAIALHNANLLESERKVHALDALLKISQEITSTLDLDHVLMTVVQQAASVVPFDKCIIGFFDRGRFMLGAVSGETEVPKTREMDDFRDRLEWVADQTEAVSADRPGEEWQVAPAEAHAQIVAILEKHGYNGFYALPLRDDQGALGVLALVGGEADFLNENHKETLAILASQTSVAIRNAQLYQQVPLANLLQPFSARKQKLIAAIPKGRRRLYLERAAIVAAILAIVPWPMRVGSNATVVPAERRTITAMDGGVVRRVFVHEGDAVQPGQLLAQLDDSDATVKLAQAQAALGQARHDVAEADFKNDTGAAGQAALRVNLHTVEEQFQQQRVTGAELRAPIAGIVVTPKVEERTGTMVKPGDAFCEIVEIDRMATEMSVPESDLALLRVGKTVALKLNAFPTDTFTGTLERIGAQTRSDAGEQYFLVRAVFANTGGLARDGMVGRARIRAGGGWFGSGWYPVGFALLRDPFRWLWQEVWIWMP
jgi:RND family efflux transporter MFP subunit